MYDIELFNAERHTTASNFRVDTNLAFANCGRVPPGRTEVRHTATGGAR